jgi:hypothetical protein
LLPRFSVLPDFNWICDNCAVMMRHTRHDQRQCEIVTV